jgi:hypothetical protein
MEVVVLRIKTAGTRGWDGRESWRPCADMERRATWNLHFSQSIDLPRPANNSRRHNGGDGDEAMSSEVDSTRSSGREGEEGLGGRQLWGNNGYN